MRLLLENKTAVITGAARGIGKAIAKRFAEEGCNIAFTDLNEESIKATEAELQTLGVKAIGYMSNAAIFEDVENTVKQIHQDFGRIDILVNNAGITRDTLMMRMTEKQWDDVITVNLKSAFNFIHAIVPIMARQRCGSIINMASVVGVSGNAGQANYAATKAGVIGMSKTWAKEFARKGANVRCNAIAPGYIMTDILKTVPQELLDKFEDEKIGDISQLSTEEKGSLVGAINELFPNINLIKLENLNKEIIDNLYNEIKLIKEKHK